MSRPPVNTLVQAVRESLLREILPALAESTASYEARVAIHVLDIIARELAAPSDASLHARLVALLGREGDDASLEIALAEAIRDGAIDATNTSLTSLLRDATLARLAVDSPRYVRAIAEET